MSIAVDSIPRDAPRRRKTVSLTITPELSYVTDSESATVKFTRLSTTVDVKEGEEVVLGGASSDADSVVVRLLGGFSKKTDEKRNSYMTVKVTVK